jgi:hypothetical protein
MLSWLSEMHSNDPSEDMLDELILQGLVEVAGIDSDTGEMLYGFTEKAKIEMPHIQREAEEFFNSLIMYFWETGFISMNMSEPNPAVSLTEKAFDQEAIASLSTEHRSALNIIKDALRID